MFDVMGPLVSMRCARSGSVKGPYLEGSGGGLCVFSGGRPKPKGDRPGCFPDVRGRAIHRSQDTTPYLQRVRQVWQADQSIGESIPNELGETASACRFILIDDSAAICRRDAIDLIGLKRDSLAITQPRRFR